MIKDTGRLYCQGANWNPLQQGQNLQAQSPVLTVARRACTAWLRWNPMEVMIATISSGGWLSSPVAPNAEAPAPPYPGMASGSAKSEENNYTKIFLFFFCLENIVGVM